MIFLATVAVIICAATGINSELHENLSDIEVKLPPQIRTYNYNHPPLYEDFLASDPDDLEVRKVRDVPENSASSVPQNSKLKRRLRGNISREVRYKEKSSPEKIPVVVVYDQDVTPLDNNKANGTITKVKRRKLQKRPPATETKVEVTSAIPKDMSTTQRAVLPKITEKSPILSTAPRTTVTNVSESKSTTAPALKTSVPKIFTKRPPEYNPVIKKMRQRDPVVKIVDEKNYVFAHSGNFHYSFEGGDGTKVSSQGELKAFDNNNTGEAVVGSVFYKDNEGHDVSLSYTADENGYRPHGAHLPTPPPIPPAIARALKYLATATTPEPITKATTAKN